MANKKDILLQAWAALFEAHPIAIKKVESLIKDHSPLGLDEYDFMLSLSREPSYKARLSVLADKTLYTRSGISRVSKRMLEKGYIKLEQCEEDKRGSYAVLLPKGITALKESWNSYSGAIVETLEPYLNVEEAKTLERLLGKIIDELRENKLVQISLK
jgi:DNA-binding MarR family transcriptional regulator